MAVRDKDTLKTFFQMGEIPSQNKFADLIDSLKHENASDTGLGDQEIIAMANRLVSIDAPVIRYYAEIGNAKVRLEITPQSGKIQPLEMKSTIGTYLAQYFLGEPPYTVRFKEMHDAVLQPTEYYLIYFETEDGNPTGRLCGNNLPIPEGFLLGVLEAKATTFQASKRVFSQQPSIVQSTIKFDNQTGIPIAYRAKSNYWYSRYHTTDSVTDHYSLWDYVNFYYRVDLTGQTDALECRLYDADTDQLLATDTISPGTYYADFYGSFANGIRNIRIECVKQLIK